MPPLLPPVAPRGGCAPRPTTGPDEAATSRSHLLMVPSSQARLCLSRVRPHFLSDTANDPAIKHPVPLAYPSPLASRGQAPPRLRPCRARQSEAQAWPFYYEERDLPCWGSLQGGGARGTRAASPLDDGARRRSENGSSPLSETSAQPRRRRGLITPMTAFRITVPPALMAWRLRPHPCRRDARTTIACRSLRRARPHRRYSPATGWVGGHWPLGGRAGVAHWAGGRAGTTGRAGGG